MAKRLNYTIGVDADTSKLESQLNKAYESLSKIGNSQQITANLQKASSSALELANNLSKAINQNTGKLDLSVFNDNLKRSGQTLNSYYDQLVQLGPAGQDAFLQVASAVVQAELPIKRTSKLLDSLWVTMKNTMRWQLTSSALHGFTGALEQAYGYAKSLDSSLNNIRIVSNKSADDMARFAEQANKAAKALSTTTTDYTDASLIYYQQGLTDQEVLDRTETTIKMANVAGTTAETASQQLTAVWNNFYDGSKSLEYYADVMVKLGAATASSSDEISEGIEKFAAVANTVGLSYDYAATALATVTAQTRESASVVGTAFRTLFSRIQGLQQGETLDDGTTLNKYSEALAKVGVDIKDTSGDLKDMDEILNELGDRWSTLAQDQKIALAETVAGVRQWTQLIALMDNWDFFQENLAIAQGSSGALEQQAKIYAESWEAARDRTKAAAEDIYDSLVNPDFYIEVDNLITPILSGTAEIIDSLGGLKGVLLVAASVMTTLYGDKMAEGIRDMAHNIGVMTGYEQIKARMLQQEGASLTDEIAGMDTKYQLESKMMNLRHQANVESDYLNTYQKQLLQADIDDLEVLRQKTNELLQQKEVSESLVRSRVNAVSSGIGAGAADLNPQTASTPKESKYISKIFSNYQAGGKQITQQKTAVAALTQEYKKVSEQVSRVNVVMGAFEKNGQKLGKTRLDVKAMGEDFKRTGENIGLFSTKLSKTEHLEKMEKASANLTAKLILLRNEIEARGGDTNYLDELDFDIQDLIKTLAAAGVSGEDFINKLNKLSAAIENQGYRIETTADKIVRFGQVVGQVAMAFQAVKNLGRVFSDEDMSAGDRLIAIFTSLSMILPLVGNATKTLTAALKAQNIASTVAAVLAKEKKLSDIENIVLRTIVAKIIKKQTAATNGHTAALGAEAVAQNIVNSSLLVFLGYAALVVAAVAAIGVAIYAMVKAYNADADAAKEAAAGVEVLSKAYDEAKNAATELKNTINDWDSAVKSIDNLTEGTKEYANAIKTANDKAKELIESQGLFDRSKWYYDDKDIIHFTDGVLEEVQSQADARERQVESSFYAGQIYSNNARIKSETTDLERFFHSIGIGASQYFFTEYGTVDRFYKNFTDNEIQSAIKLLKETQDAGPISNTELVDKFNDLIPGLNLSVESLDVFRARLETLSESMDDASEANNYYFKEILKNNLEGNRGEQLKDIVEDNENLYNSLLDAYAALENRFLEKNDQALSNVTVDESNYSSNNKLGEFIHQNIDGNEGLARLYAGMVLGRTDVDQLNYKDGQLQTSSGENLFDEALSDDYMRKMIAQTYAQQKLIESLGEKFSILYEPSLKRLVNGANSLGDAFGGVDLATPILNQLAQGTESIDLSTLFTQLSPDDIDKLIDDSSKDEIIKKLGLTEKDFAILGYTDANTWWENFKKELSRYDAAIYWENLAEKSKKSAEDVGGILASYQSDKELSEEQIIILDKLGKKYSNLNKLREQGGHEYLQTLREIQEQEEENSIIALKNLKQTQQEKADALQQEINRLKTVQERATSTKYKDILQVQIDAKTEEFDKVINDILDTNYQIDIAVNADLKSDIDQAFGLADELEKIQSYLSDGLEISFDRAQEIIEAGYGAMLTNAQETADNTIKLNQDVVNRFIDGKQLEINADKQSKISQLESERSLLVTKQESLQAGIDALNTGLNATDNTAKAEALIQASKYKAQADAAEITAEQEADAADQSNDEIATDAKNLVNALGIMHETNAENSQQAYKDAETAASKSAKSQINALNQIQKAAVAYSNAIRDSANGTATYHPVIFSGSSNVSIGATRSKRVNNTYETTEADINISTKDILKAANNNTEVLDQALKKAKAELEAQKTSVDAQIGAVDAGIAALKSADLSLDKIQSGSDKSGSGSKDKTYDKEDLKTLEEVEDRYHEINRQIERQEDLLDDLSNATDRAWGTDALNGYENEIEALEKQQELYNQKLKEAQDYLVQDSALVKKYFADAQIGADGEITNYEDLLRENLNLYNAAVERYNLAVASKTLSEEEHTALKNQLEIEKALFEARQKTLEQYESTLDVIRDTTDKIQENARSIADKKLEEIKFKMEIVLDVKSMKDAVRDLSKEIAEMFGDALTHGLESAKLSAEGAQAEVALLPSYQEEWNSLKALYESTTDDADRRAIMDEIQSLQGNIIDSAKAIAEWANSIEDIVPDAVDAASERFAAFTDQLEHNTSVLDTIKELYTLQGVTYKTAEGFNRLQKNSQEKLNAQLASAKLQRGWYEQAAQRLEEAQAKLDSLGGDETDLRYDAYKKARDAYLEEFNEAQEAYLSSAKEAMETAQDMYLQQIEKAVYEFGQAVSNGVGLDLLQDKYDHYIEQNERYFDKVNEAYQVSAWYNKLQQDIDNTTNSAHKERLKALQEEINQRREGNKLSQYDLDILNAKYQVLQAQMALEDAQNAKNQIQLVRDSQGNWNYQYTADQDQIANAQQNLLDAENDWYNIAKQQVTDVTGEIISTWQECQDKIKEIYSDMTLTDEERADRAAEIYQYYSEKVKYLEEEKQNAISDMTEAGNKNLIDNAIITGDTITDLTGVTAEEIKQVVENYTGNITDLLLANNEQLEEIFGDNTKFIDLFDNTYAKDLANMTQNATNFESELRKLLDQAQADFDNYKEKVQNVASETGTTLDDLAQETDKVSDATEQLRDRGLEATDSLWNMIDAAQNASDSYLDLADSIWEAVQALQDLAAAQADFAASQSTSSHGNSKKDYDPNTDYSGVIMDGIANGWLEYGSDEYKELVRQRENKIDDMELKEDQYGTRGDAADERYKNSSSVGQYNDFETWKKKMHELGVPGYATGGYTGIFDDEKLAFLHQKELVLNQTDTENILAAVRMVRDFGSDFFNSIEKVLDSNAFAAMAFMGQKLNPIITMPVQDSIEQIVHIDKVEFPNVTSRTEIEEAFVSLTNDAAQWARRKS